MERSAAKSIADAAGEGKAATHFQVPVVLLTTLEEKVWILSRCCARCFLACHTIKDVVPRCWIYWEAQLAGTCPAKFEETFVIIRNTTILEMTGPLEDFIEGR